MKLNNLINYITGFECKIKKGYIPIINTLLNNMVTDKISDYEIKEIQDKIVRNIKIVTENGTEEEIQCITYYDTIEREFINFKLEKRTPTSYNFIELYYKPFIVNTIETNENSDIQYEKKKFIFIKNNGSDTLNVRINTEVKYEQDKLKSDTTYETDDNNIEKIIENMTEIPQSIENFTKRKTLK